MKSYPSIPSYKYAAKGVPIYAFEKLDGSNIRAEWNKKNGWFKFGSRNGLIDENHAQLGEAIPLFLEKYGEWLPIVFKEKQYREAKTVTVFFEYGGPNSFAGNHEDEEHDVVLFDVNPIKKGFVPAADFVRDFEALGIPRVVYKGNLNQELVEKVKANVYGLDEGVVCKGVWKNQIYMAKIKTDQWLERLKEKHPAMYEQEALDNLLVV